MTDHVAAALDLLGNRTGCEVAKVHALLAIAAAIRETPHASGCSRCGEVRRDGTGICIRCDAAMPTPQRARTGW